MARSRLLQDPGRRQQGLAGGHQEGVPQARAQVPPRHNKDAGAEERFKQISEAYDVARRPGEAQALRPRRLARSAAATRSAAAPAAAAHGGRLRLVLGHPLGHLQHGRRARHAHEPAAERGRDLETTVSLSFEQAVEGAQVPVSVATHAAVPDLPRHRARSPGTPPVVCPVCHGRGVESQGQGLFSITRPCDAAAARAP